MKKLTFNPIPGYDINVSLSEGVEKNSSESDPSGYFDFLNVPLAEFSLGPIAIVFSKNHKPKGPKGSLLNSGFVYLGTGERIFKKVSQLNLGPVENVNALKLSERTKDIFYMIGMWHAINHKSFIASVGSWDLSRTKFPDFEYCLTPFEKHDQGMFRLLGGISLLAKDERFVEPLLLKRDSGKKLSQEQKQKAIERARARGKNGFTIGEHFESSPHIRSPHFAIRWTGKGKTVPKLTPISGSVVNRTKIYPIPTGYEGQK